MCSELTPRARIPDTRIPQLMQPWALHAQKSQTLPSGSVGLVSSATTDCWSHLYCALPISLFPIYPCAHNALVIPCIRGSFGDQWKYSTLLCSIWEMSSAIWYNSHILSQQFTNLCTYCRRSQLVIGATPNDFAATIPPLTNHYKDIIAATSHSHIPNDWFHQVMSREYTGSPPSISNGGVRICSACHNNLPLVIIICY